jgi:uncharacterized membrane protein YhaH (DUF805 family)
MLAALKHGLGNLVNFHGRDSRQAFWYYVLFVYIVTIVISMVVMVPTMIEAFVTGIQQGMAASQTGDPAAMRAANQAMAAKVMASTMSSTLGLSIVTGVVMLVLLAAAFVRRLHDSNLPGWWALIPGAAQAVNLLMMPGTIRRMMDAMSHIQPGDPTAGYHAMQGSYGPATLLGWAAIILVIVFGVRKSTSAPNRYGEAPFTA